MYWIVAQGSDLSGHVSYFFLILMICTLPSCLSLATTEMEMSNVLWFLIAELQVQLSAYCIVNATTEMEMPFIF